MKKVLEAINNVKKETEAIAKTGENQHHRYKYATHNDVLNEVREVMIKNKLVIIPSDVKDVDIIQKSKVSGGVMETETSHIQSFTQVYMAYHTEECEPVQICIRCSGFDTGDKSAYKANTGAMKYLFIDLFHLPTDADPENDQEKTPAMKLSPKEEKEKPWLNLNTPEWEQAVKDVKGGKHIAGLYQKFKLNKEVQNKLKELTK